MRNTTFYTHLATLKGAHVYRKSRSKYKQDIDLERQAYRLALSDWAAQQPSMQAMLAQPGLPAHLRAQAQHAWQARHAAAVI